MTTINEMKNSVLLIIIRLITLDYLVIKKEVGKWIPKTKIEILDIGCGLGYFANLFDKKGYLGIDINPDSISTAKKAHPSYNFQVADAANFKSRQKFDLVLVVGVFHHLTNHQMSKTLNLAKDTLRKNGKIIIVEAIPPILKFNILGKLIRSLDQGHFIRRKDEYEKSVKKKFDITYSKEKLGGLVDYAVIIGTNQSH